MPSLFPVRDARHDVVDSGVEGLEDKELATVIHRIGDDLGGWLQVSNNTLFLINANPVIRLIRLLGQGVKDP